MEIYLKWFIISFVPCLLVWAICEEFISRREGGWWPWKVPLYRRNKYKNWEPEDYLKELKKPKYNPKYYKGGPL